MAACNDQEHGLLTGTPTVKRLSMRILAALSRSYQLKLFTRDVTKAFVQSTSTLNRPVFMRAPREMKFPVGKVVKVISPLYGMPESPMHWFTTYLNHQKNRLGMNQVPIDPHLLYQTKDGLLQALLTLQVDDTLYAANDSFMKQEERFASEFPSKGHTPILANKVRFNGIDFSILDEGIVMRQRYYIEGIPPLPAKRVLTFETFRRIRAKLAYAAFSTCSDGLVYIAYLSQFTTFRYREENMEAMRILRKAVKVIKSTPSINGLNFVRIEPKRLEVVACIDASFATNKERLSQLGILVMLRNAKLGLVNVIHYSSTKSQRI